MSKSEYIVNQSLIYVEEPDVEEKLLLEDKSMDPLSTQRYILNRDLTVVHKLQNTFQEYYLSIHVRQIRKIVDDKGKDFNSKSFKIP